MLRYAGIYGYIAIALGALMLLVAIVAVVGKASKLRLFQIAAWSLVPILVGYWGSFYQAKLAQQRMGEAVHITSADLEATRHFKDSTYVGLLAALPAVTVSLSGLLWRARQDAKRREQGL